MRQIKFNTHVRGVAGIIAFYFTGHLGANEPNRQRGRTHGDYLHKDRLNYYLNYCWRNAKSEEELAPLAEWMRVRGIALGPYQQQREKYCLNDVLTQGAASPG